MNGNIVPWNGSFMNLSVGNETLIESHLDLGIDLKPISQWLELMVLLAALIFLSIVGCIKALEKIKALYNEIDGSTDEPNNAPSGLWMRLVGLSFFRRQHVGGEPRPMDDLNFVTIV